MRWCAGPVAVIGVYDTVGGQLELPTLRKLFGMSSNLLPWWGWLLILQAFFVVALFEYVRRNIGQGPVVSALPGSSDFSGADTSRGAGPEDAVLQRQMLALSERIAQTNVVINDFGVEIDTLRKSVAPIIRDRQDRLQSDLVEWLQRLKLPRPKQGDKWTNREPSALNINRNGWIGAKFLAAGFEDKVNDVITEAYRQVNADALNCTINANEIGIWKDEQSKQHWHRHNAAIEALIQKVGR